MCRVIPLQLYMGMWAREATTPCMNPDGRDLMTAVQVGALFTHTHTNTHTQYTLHLSPPSRHHASTEHAGRVCVCVCVMQLYAVSQILNDDVWAFHSQQPQPEGLSSQVCY